MSDQAVYRTAPATLGLLISVERVGKECCKSGDKFIK